MNHKYFEINEPTCISFSGGRTSAYMLWRVLQANGGKLPDEAVVCFANTGKEDEATLKFVHDCATNWNVPITWLEWSGDQDPKFKIVDFETASRNGEPFENCIRYYKKLPNPAQRWCTGQLKIRTIHRYLRSLGWDHHETDNNDFIGIRADEPRRAAKMPRHKTPLVADNVTKETISNFWNDQSFQLNLAIHRGESLLGNCDLCFLKSMDKKMNIARTNPEKTIWWAKMEQIVTDKQDREGAGNLFRKDHPSYREMAHFSLNQQELFGDESIDCFCGD
jgi:3'-phosphoadenosine 5'-phosphosulfate sulfotransferase (PAPS reductase)/FAD synthetase